MDSTGQTAEFERRENITKNSILVVEDDKLIALELTNILTPKYIVYLSRNGADAIELAKELKPDIILLDVVMPGMSGFDVIATLKGIRETSDIPIIFVTGLSNAKDEEKGLVLGAADYIQKPFTPSIVKLRVRNQVKIINQMRLIQHLSITDTLTNTANRRQFNTWLDQEWKRAVRHKSPLSLLMLDIDHFKVYNDNFGHLQGDTVLQVIANTIKKELKRPLDLVARWGGEEFAILLPDTHMAGACKVAEDIRASIEKHIIMFEEKTPTRVTASIGINCIVPEHHSFIERFVSDADKSLYRAKETGRNRVVTSEAL
ncbi:MAG: diguanylate cyclase [Defluviitaleaceae bacterium]|nr:diguanylate cyclase [Defluviitaleaceae bacterium]